MNKSKFLKKSLAMLLALMLVFAMIPLSASAAEGPAVTEVTVNGVTATGSDTSLTAAITEPTGDVNVTVEIENDAADVGYYGDATLKDTNEAKKVGEVWQFTLSEGDQADKAFTFDVLDKASKQPVETYTVTYTTVPADGDASVKSVYLDGQYGCWNNTDTRGEIHYTVVAPYNYTLDNSTYVEVTPNGAGASVTPNNGTVGSAYKVPVTAYDSRVEFTVTAANGNTENYTVTVVKPIPFATFSVEGERHEARIERVTEEPITWEVTPVSGTKSKPQVEAYLPYEYGSTKFTATFTTNYSVKVYAEDEETGDPVELISGNTYDWSKLNTETAADTNDVIIPIVVKYSDGKEEPWTLALDVRTNTSKEERDTIPAIKGVIAKNYVAEIEGTTITLTLPQSVRDNCDDLQLKISEGTVVNVVDTDKVYKATGTKGDGFVKVKGSTTNPFPSTFFQKDSYTLRVTAAIEEFDADEKAVQDYTLNIVTAKVEKPQLNSLTLKSEKTGETLEGRIDHEAGRVYFEGENAIPYRYKNVKAMADDEWQLFWSVPSGTTLTWNATSEAPSDTIVVLSGTEVNKDMQYLPQIGRFDNTVANAYIVVANDTSSRAYKVVFTSAEASKNADLGKVQLAWNEVAELDDLNTQNTVDAIVNNDNTITATIRYKDWDKFNAWDDKSNTGTGKDQCGAAFVTTLPAGAELYWVASNGDLYEVDTLNEENPTIKSYLASVNAAYQYGTTWNLNTKQHDKAPETLTLVVVSEALAEKVHGQKETGGSIDTYTKLNTTANAGMFQKYELTLTQAEPGIGNKLTSLSVYDNYTGAKVDGVLVGNTFTITLPYYFTDSSRWSLDNLYLDYAPYQGGQTVYAESNSGSEKVELNYLVKKEDGSVDTDASVKLEWNAATADTTNAFKVYKDNDSKKDVAWIGYTKYDSDNKVLKDYQLNVKAENPDTKENVYDVVIKVADPEGGAVLNSVSYGSSTATPNSDNEVTLNVPFSTEVTSMALDFNVSENAYVVEGGPENIGIGNARENIVDEGETFNFLTTRTFTVVSENHAARETYTITVVPSETFSDVTTDQWYYDEVMTAANKGWINGTKPGYFEPEADMTRGQFVTIVARIMNYDESAYSKSAFPDVDSDIYYSAAAAFCKEQNIIDGDDKGNFNGEDPITREEMAKIMCQALQLKVTIPEKTYADDAEIAQWAKGYVYACQEAGIMEGSGDNFNPRDNATRAEGAAVLVRAFA